MKRLVFILMFLAGCQEVPLLDIAAATVHVCGGGMIQGGAGSGTVIHVEDMLVADRVTILTSLHVVDGPVAPLVAAHKRNARGARTATYVAIGEVTARAKELGLAMVTCTMPSGYVRPVKVAREVPRFGDRLYGAGYPGHVFCLTEGRFGGATPKGRIFTGGTTFGNSGGGVYNDRLELVGVLQAMLRARGLPYYNAGLWTPVVRGEIKNVLRAG